VTCVSVRCAHPTERCRRCGHTVCAVGGFESPGVCVSCAVARRYGKTAETQRSDDAWERGIALVIERQFSEPEVSAPQRRSRQ
jgi:hypothetical protein